MAAESQVQKKSKTLLHGSRCGMDPTPRQEPRSWLRVRRAVCGVACTAVAASSIRIYANSSATSGYSSLWGSVQLFAQQYLTLSEVPIAVKCAREGPLFIHGKQHQRTFDDPPAEKFTADEGCLCSRLLETTPSDDSVFLFEVLRLHCAGYEFQDLEPFKYIPKPGQPVARSGGLFDLHLAQCDFSDPVFHLPTPSENKRALVVLASAPLGNFLDPLRSTCDVCALLRGWKNTGHLVKRDFVLIDSLAMNFGALTSGIDWVCSDDSGPLELRKATIKACRIVSFLRQSCPEFTIKDFSQFLEWPRLKSYFVGQDAVMVRPNPKLGDEWKVHPKVHIMPLGWGGASLSSAGPAHSRYIYSMNREHIEGHWTLRLFNAYFKVQHRPHLAMAIFSSRSHRTVLLEQLIERVRIPKELRAPMKGPLYRKSLLTAKTALSPPGWGADCYRHYETLAHGTALLVPVSSIALSALRSLPVIVADDMAIVTEDELSRSLGKLTAEAHRRRELGDPRQSIMYALTKRYVIESIQWVADDAHNGSSWPLPNLSVRLRRQHKDDTTTGIFTQGHIGTVIRNLTRKDREKNQAAWEPGGSFFEGFGSGDGADYCECPCQCGLCDSDIPLEAVVSPLSADAQGAARKARIEKRQSELWPHADCSCQPTFEFEDRPKIKDTRTCSGSARRRRLLGPGS